MVDWSQVALAGVWGGLLALERRAFLQAMFSRPLVAATSLGLLLGEVESGLFVGMLLELYHLGAANLGAALPENDTIAATGCSAAAASCALSTGGGGTPAIWALAIILFGWLGALGRKVDRWLEPYNTRLARKATARAEHGELRRAVRQNLWGMWPHFLIYGALVGGCAVAGYLVGPAVARLPLQLVRGLAWAYPAMGAVAAAIAARGSHARHSASYAAAVAALVVVAMVALTCRRVA
ncbi:MAG TPA: PTS sugar transporter subunit IIC [Myxococcaceae bacterium]|jgi:PTS system mannose-specific IIC component